MLDFLKNEGISNTILKEIERFRANFSVENWQARGDSHDIF